MSSGARLFPCVAQWVCTALAIVSFFCFLRTTEGAHLAAAPSRPAYELLRCRRAGDVKVWGFCFCLKGEQSVILRALFLYFPAGTGRNKSGRGGAFPIPKNFLRDDGKGKREDGRKKRLPAAGVAFIAGDKRAHLIPVKCSGKSCKGLQIPLFFQGSFW